MTASTRSSQRGADHLPPDAFELKDKFLLLRLFRIGRLPSALYGGQILWEKGFPVLALEYGELHEEHKRVFESFPRLRWAFPFCTFLPAKLRAGVIFFAAFFRLLMAIIWQGAPRMILAHGLQEQCLARLLRFFCGVQYAVHVHEAFDYKDVSPLNKLFLLFEGECLRRAEFLIFPERTRAQIYANRYRLKNERIIAFNCPRKELLHTSTELPPSLKVPRSMRRLLYVGGIGENNALVNALEAIKELENVVFTLVGWIEREEKEKLIAHAENFGVADRLQVLGVVDDDTKWALMRSSDIAYCVYEPKTIRLRYLATASNKFMEALACGLPVITNNSPDFQSVVLENNVGLTLENFEPQTIAKAIQSLLADEEKLSQQRENAKRVHQERFNYESQFRPVVSQVGEYFGKEREYALAGIS